MVSKRPPRVLILVGSTNTSRRPRNPWTYQERHEIITDSVNEVWGEQDPIQSKSLTEELYVYLGRYQPFHMGHLDVINRVAERHGMAPSVEVQPLPDMTYNLEGWLQQAHGVVSKFEQDPKNVHLVGHAKDVVTSDYLDLFPTWKQFNVPAFTVGKGVTLDASDIRKKYLASGSSHGLNVSNATRDFLNRFRGTEHFEYVLEYERFVRKYRKDNHVDDRSVLRYPPTFNTVDACVVQSGHVLVVKRNAHPGKGLWALPGGYFDAGKDLSTEAAMLRELREETGIKLQDKVLRRCITKRVIFDDMHRSELGRMLTHASLIHLDPGPFPKIKRKDADGEVQDVIWMPIGDVRGEDFHDDHSHIIANLTGDL